MLRAVLVCGMGLLAIAGCARQRDRLQQEIVPTREQLLREGQRTYERACSSCHGLDAPRRRAGGLDAEGPARPT